MAWNSCSIQGLARSPGAHLQAQIKAVVAAHQHLRLKPMRQAPWGEYTGLQCSVTNRFTCVLASINASGWIATHQSIQSHIKICTTATEWPRCVSALALQLQQRSPEFAPICCLHIAAEQNGHGHRENLPFLNGLP